MSTAAGDHERGAWRVRRGDPKTEALLSDLGVEVTPIPPRPVQEKKVGQPQVSLDQGSRGLSERDALVLSGHAPRDEWRFDHGYHGVLDKALGSRVYGTGRGEGSEYGCLLGEGWSGVIERMREHLDGLGAKVRVRTGCRYTGYEEGRVSWVRVGEGESSTERGEGRAAAVVLAIPPSAFPPGELPELAATVQAHSLCHVWLRSDPPTVAADVLSDWPLSQASTNPMSEGSGLLHVYAMGRDADFWRRVHRASAAGGRCSCDDLLEKAVAKQLGKESTLGSVVPQPTSLEVVDVNYWEHAVHSWRPCANFPGAKTAQRRSLRPDWALRPGLFVCGEAFSRHQGWAEGALETADLVVEGAIEYLEGMGELSKPREIHDKNRNKTASARYRSMRVVIPSAWYAQHPGGESVLWKFMRGDIDDLWWNVHGRSSESLCTLFHMLEECTQAAPIAVVQKQ